MTDRKSGTPGGSAHRLQEHCTSASQNYAAAATAAYAEVANAAFNSWIDTLQNLSPQPEKKPRSWYRHPDHKDLMDHQRSATRLMSDTANASASAFGGLPTNPFYAMGAFAPLNPAMAMFMGFTGSRSDADTARSVSAQPFWAIMAPAPQGPPQTASFASAFTWPMAAAMMSAGVPHRIAWPTASGNAAAMAATQSALEVLQANMQAFGEITERMTQAGQTANQRPSDRPSRTETSSRDAFASPLTAPMEMALNFQRMGNDMFATWCGMAGGFNQKR